MQISIKHICNWPIYGLPYSIYRWMTGLHYADFLSLHYIVYESTSCNRGTKSNYCQLPSYIHHRATYLSLRSYLFVNIMIFSKISKYRKYHDFFDTYRIVSILSIFSKNAPVVRVWLLSKLLNHVKIVKPTVFNSI